jgi:hypothetical protein
MLKMKKLFRLQRSAHAPVTIVAGGVHERHHVQEHHDHRAVVSRAGQEEAGLAEQSPAAVAGDGRADGEHLVHRREPAELARAADRGSVVSAAHQGEAADEESEHAQCINQEVHAHGVRCVLGPAEARLNEREARLHKDHQEAGDQHPHHVHRVVELGQVLCDLLDGGLVARPGFPRSAGDGVEVSCQPIRSPSP